MFTTKQDYQLEIIEALSKDDYPNPVTLAQSLRLFQGQSSKSDCDGDMVDFDYQVRVRNKLVKEIGTKLDFEYNADGLLANHADNYDLASKFTKVFAEKLIQFIDTNKVLENKVGKMISSEEVRWNTQTYRLYAIPVVVSEIKQRLS